MMNASDLRDAFLRPRIIEDPAGDGFAMIRCQDGRAVEVAVAHDGTREGVDQAEAIARLITATPQLRDLVSEAIHVWAAAFDAPPDIEGCVSGDAVMLVHKHFLAPAPLRRADEEVAQGFDERGAKHGARLGRARLGRGSVV